MKGDLTFSDYMVILFRWKYFILINVIIVGGITAGLTLLMPNEYRSVATLMIPPENPFSIAALTGFGGSKSGAASLGAKLFGSSKSTEDVILGILNSRSVFEKVIAKFNMSDYYKIKDKSHEKTIKAFRADVVFDQNEYGMIDIAVINKDPATSAAIVNYFSYLVDSTHRKINADFALLNREYIEKRYLKNETDLKNAENDLHAFQKKYNIFAVPQQLEASVKAAGELESSLVMKEIAADLAKQQFGENSPQYKGMQYEISLLRSRVHDLKNSGQLTKESNILFPFSKAPDIVIEYLKVYREVEIQTKIMEIILPMYEQAKVEEHKDAPSLAVLDPANIPDFKYAPKRSFITLFVTLPVLFLLMIIAFRGEKSLRMAEMKNSFLLRENKIFKGLAKIFRVK